MTSSRSSQGQSGGGDAVAHVVQGAARLRKCQPQNLRDSHELAARSEFVKLRTRFGTQAGTAEELQVSRATVENWERGATAVPGWALFAIRELTRGTGT